MLNILDTEGEIRNFPKCETPARVSHSKKLEGCILGIPVTRQIFGKVENLPEFKSGTFYIVSRLVEVTAKKEGRKTSDLLIPGPAIRDKEGWVIATKGWLLRHIIYLGASASFFFFKLIFSYILYKCKREEVKAL